MDDDGISIAGWWFQTCYIFHNIWDNHSHWLSYVSIWLLQHLNQLDMLWAWFKIGPFLVDWLTSCFRLLEFDLSQGLAHWAPVFNNLTTVNNKYGSNQQRAVKSYGQIPKLGSQGASWFGWYMLVSYLNQSPKQKRKQRGLRKKKHSVSQKPSETLFRLMVWIFFYFPYIGNNPPNWRTPSFFRGVYHSIHVMEWGR